MSLAEAKQIFDKAVDIPPDRRFEYLETVCAKNSDIRTQVEEMLAEFEKDSGEIDPPFECAPDTALSSIRHEEFGGTKRFAVQGRLGSGAFGSVYRAWDREQRALVALKVLTSLNP